MTFALYFVCVCRYRSCLLCIFQFKPPPVGREKNIPTVSSAAPPKKNKQTKATSCCGWRPIMPEVTLLEDDYYLELRLITVIDIYLPYSRCTITTIALREKSSG